MILELSGNPIAVLENVTEAQDIAVQPGAVWEIPEKARAYLLDLLQGGGVSLHVEFVEPRATARSTTWRRSPRSAFGETRQALSGVALQMELDPLLKKVQRKRLIRAGRPSGAATRWSCASSSSTPASSFAPYRSRVVWGAAAAAGPLPPVEDETRLVAAGIHSRRRAADELGVEDPEGEFERWRTESAAIESGRVS